MNRLQVKTASIALALAGVAIPALAHHSSAMFDDKKEITVTGVVKEFQYTNPHSWMLVDVTGPDGKVTTWGFEAEGPSTLQRAGIRKTDLLPGMPVTVTGHPMRDGRPAAAWIKATRMTDKKEFVPRAGFAIR